MQKKHTSILMSFLFTCATCFAHAQDTSWINKNVHFDMTGGFDYFPGSLYSTVNAYNILLPNQIKTIRVEQNNLFNPTWKSASDNPMYHGAYYLEFNAKADVVKGVTIYGSLIGENRGASYGVTNTANIIVYPELTLVLDRNINIGNQTIRVAGSFGNQTDPTLYEGLTMYNLYLEGNDFSVGWHKLKFRWFEFSNMDDDIGLNIHNSFDYILSLDALKLTSTWKLDIQAGFSDYQNDPLYIRTNYVPSPITPDILSDPTSADAQIFNLSAGAYVDNKLRIYAQVSSRPFEDIAGTGIERYAALAGLHYKKASDKWRTELTAEARYYGKGFNANFKNTDVFYRNTSNQIGWANTIGPQFYPMFMYDRPFSQWAVFTEYQNGQSYDNVGALTAHLKEQYFFHKRLFIQADLDFNYMLAEGDAPFLYPFYTVGIGWEPAKNNTAMICITNKGMNLDMHYYTFYLYQYPYIGFLLKRSLDPKWREKS